MPMDWGLARDYAARDVHTQEVPVTEAEWLGAPLPPLRPLEDEQDWGGIAVPRLWAGLVGPIWLAEVMKRDRGRP
jgi:hypothetical protein